MKASSLRAGVVACTGNTGCKFAASDTKRHADAIVEHCEGRAAIDGPLNIHLTGCHHSCAQHYVSDIGLLAARVATNEEGDTVEGYHIYAGGGFGPNADCGYEVYRDVKAEDAPKAVEGLAEGLPRASHVAGRNIPCVLAPLRRRGTEEAGGSGSRRMNQIIKPPNLEIIPSSAPFSDAQRAWLNGFFAGVLQLDGTTPLPLDAGAAVLGGDAGR